MLYWPAKSISATTLILSSLIGGGFIFISCENESARVAKEKQKRQNDSIAIVKRDSTKKAFYKELDEKYAKQGGRNTTAEAKSLMEEVKKKGLDWDEFTCWRIINKQVWIGMTIKMLKYERGEPNHVNVSNYGNGEEYQWCWDDKTPSCFYGKSDGIITSYN